MAKKVRELMERGVITVSPETPLADIGKGYEPNWWVKKWLEREGITAEELRTALGKLND